MTDPLDGVLVELEQFGQTNDASTVERTRRMLNITRDTGESLPCWSERRWRGGCSRLVRRTAIRHFGSRTPPARSVGL
jgi:hypothetical protein